MANGEQQQEKAKEIEKKESHPLAKVGFTFLPQTWAELYSYAKEISQTDFVPKNFVGKPGAVLACWQKGQEVGLPPMAALENIAIINGRPAIHSNGYWSLIVNHPLCEWFKETPPDEALKQGYGECTIKRVGNPHPVTRRFSLEEAKTAGLLDKDNWKHYPGDMLQNRARHRAGDDAVPEACQGLIPADVARDLEPRDVTPIDEPKDKKPALEQLKDNLKADKEPPPQSTTETVDEPQVEGAGQTVGGKRDPVDDLLADIESMSTRAGINELQAQLNKRLADAGIKGNDILKITNALNARKKEIEKIQAKKEGA